METINLKLLDGAVKEFLDNMKEWINQSLGGADTRVSISNLEEDLKDGMVLKCLLEKHTGTEIRMPCGDFVQSQERQLTNVEYLLQYFR